MKNRYGLNEICVSLWNFKTVNLLLLAFLNIFPLQTQAWVFQAGQNKTVSGIVTDAETGETLPGVNVIVKGTTIGTSTDSEGDYQLDVPSLNEVLVFSFVGYETKEIPINGRTSIDVILQIRAFVTDELVVIGYGQRHKSDLTGSVNSITSEDFNADGVSSLDEILSGKAAGVQVVQGSGAPGGNNAVSIRGTGSINASNSPLYVIDGLPIDNNRLQGTSLGDFTQNESGRNPLSTINPNDIASIEILKDASATAILWGKRVKWCNTYYNKTG